ncbi:MAG TPA: tetratricopeptide repeat protein [Opitutaceae bacterium]|nr:tetratricopeptide repeat protein [Opitutaceae bacterium]
MNESLAINYALGGTKVEGYHAMNLGIHLLAALVLFGLVRRTLQQPVLQRHAGAALPLAFLTALLWAVHPLQTESVDYVVQRAESLMGLFYLLTLYSFVRWARRGARAWAVAAVVSCLLGMATKEVMASAPLIVWLYDRTFVSGSFREAWRRHRRLHIALMATWLLLGWLVLDAGGRGGTAGFAAGVAWWQYALTQASAIVHYLRLSLWPFPLVFDYGTELATRPTEAAPAVLLIVGLVAGTGLALWRRPVIGFIGAWFFAILAPSSSFVPVATQTIAEHRMYLSLAAVILAGVLVLYHLLGRRSLPLLLGLAVAFAFLTVQRHRAYSSALALWRDTVAKRPLNPRAQNSLGTVLLMQHQLQDAIACFEAAIRSNPDYSLAQNNLGVALVQFGRPGDAIVHYEAALRLSPADGEIPHNLGDALILAGRIPEAMVQYQHALALRPEFADAQANNLGSAFLQAGQTARAIGFFEAALQAKPDFAEAHSNLGNALAQTGRLPEAITHYEAALRSQPDDAETHFNLGNALYQTGHLREAMLHYDAALRAKPDFAEAHANLGSALLQAGRREEAVQQYRKALRIQPDLPDARDNLIRLGESIPAQASPPK